MVEILGVWVLDVGFGAVGDVVLRVLDFCFVSAVICPSLLIGVTHVLSVRKDFIYMTTAFWA